MQATLEKVEEEMVRVAQKVTGLLPDGLLGSPRAFGVVGFGIVEENIRLEPDLESGGKTCHFHFICRVSPGHKQTFRFGVVWKELEAKLWLFEDDNREEEEMATLPVRAPDDLTEAIVQAIGRAYCRYAYRKEQEAKQARAMAERLGKA